MTESNHGHSGGGGGGIPEWAVWLIGAVVLCAILVPDGGSTGRVSGQSSYRSVESVAPPIYYAPPPQPQPQQYPGWHHQHIEQYTVHSQQLGVQYCRGFGSEKQCGDVTWFGD